MTFEAPTVQAFGVTDETLTQTVSARLGRRFDSGDYTDDLLAGVKKFDFSVLHAGTKLETKDLELLRRACQVWDIDLRVREISSHRKFIGPFIVAGKKIMFRLLRVLLKDMIRQQREFNACAIALLGRACRERRG